MGNRNCKLLFVGDVFIGSKGPDSIVSSSFKELMSKYDLVGCNFEATIGNRGAPAVKAGPVLRQGEEAVWVLSEDGFSCFGLANNHIMDYGPEALEVTLQALNGKIVAGAALRAEEAYAPAIVDINGLKLGILALAEAYEGFVKFSDKEEPGFAWLCDPAVHGLVEKVKDKVDFLVIQVHAGVEEATLPLPELREIMRELVGRGADVVIGHHPHVPLGWEEINGKPIFYSLGNFWFDYSSDHPLWNKGYAVSLSLGRGKQVAYEVLPTVKINDRVELDEANESRKYLEEMRDLLQSKDYDELCTKQALELWQEPYQRYYLQATNGVLGTTAFRRWWQLARKRWMHPNALAINRRLLLHVIQIESHRWTVERALRALIRDEF